MWKPQSLRATLRSFLEWVKTDPEKLEVYVDKGTIVATAAKSASFEYRYFVVIEIKSFAGDPDLLFMAIVVWLRKYQNDILQNHSQTYPASKEPFTFEVFPINNTSVDIDIRLSLTEAVFSDLIDGKLQIKPKRPEMAEQWEFWVRDELIASFTDKPEGWPDL